MSSWLIIHELIDNWKLLISKSNNVNQFWLYMCVCYRIWEAWIKNGYEIQTNDWKLIIKFEIQLKLLTRIQINKYL